MKAFESSLPTSQGPQEAGRTQVVAARVPPKVVAAAVAGAALEYYDFLTYAFFAVYIGKAFFPSVSPMASLLAAVAVFGVGFIARPLGAAVIGAYADRAGRKPALLLTIVLITAGTMGLALTPSYESIGVLAPILVVACRVAQGLALGGEVGPATAFLVEAAPPGRRGFYSSWQVAAQGAAAIAAGILGAILSLKLSPEDMQSWGWRVPFALGVLLVPVTLYLRGAMPETLREGGHSKGGASIPGLLKGQTRLIVVAIFITCGATVSAYVGTYMTTFAITTLKLPAASAMAATLATGVATLAFALIGGWAADTSGGRLTIVWPRVATAFFIVPGFWLLVQQPSAWTLVAVTGGLAALSTLSAAASFVIIAESFPAQIRATGLAITYAVAVTVFGGSTQFVVTWLISATGDPLAPAWYVAGASVVTVIAVAFLPKARVA